MFLLKNIIIFDKQNRTEQFMDFDINFDSDIPRYQQLIFAVNDALSNNTLSSVDALPSVNAVCKNHNLSRDTVFKAYSILKFQQQSRRIS